MLHFMGMLLPEQIPLGQYVLLAIGIASPVLGNFDACHDHEETIYIPQYIRVYYNIL